MNIVLTGASRGIGYYTARALCSYEIENLILISRNSEALHQLKQECLLLNKDINITLIPGDLTVMTKKADLFLDRLPFNKLDVLINNAGLLVKKPFEEMTDADMIHMFDMNAITPLNLVRILLNYLKNSASSHIVNIGSMSGFQGSSKYPGLSYYSASKAALASLTECLAAEFSKTSMHFNCLALGAVQTEMLAEAFPGFEAPVNPLEMGKYIAEFAINGHKFFNGQIIPVRLSNP